MKTCRFRIVAIDSDLINMNKENATHFILIDIKSTVSLKIVRIVDLYVHWNSHGEHDRVNYI